jgi:hypothetical protein
MPYPGEHSLRLQDPGKFSKKEGSWSRTAGGKLYGGKTTIPSTVGIIWAKSVGKDGPSDPPIPQSLRFPIAAWGTEPKKAEDWIKENKINGRFEKAEPKKNDNEDINTVEEFGDKGNVSTWLQAAIHAGFTRAADQLLRIGIVNTEQRIKLSSAVGDALDTFVKAIEKKLPAAKGITFPRPADIKNGIGFYIETEDERLKYTLLTVPKTMEGLENDESKDHKVDSILRLEDIEKMDAAELGRLIKDRLKAMMKRKAVSINIFEDIDEEHELIIE